LEEGTGSKGVSFVGNVEGEGKERIFKSSCKKMGCMQVMPGEKRNFGPDKFENVSQVQKDPAAEEGWLKARLGLLPP